MAANDTGERAIRTEADIDAAADHWLAVNRKAPSEVRYRAWPIGFVARWIERAQEAESGLTDIDCSLAAIGEQLRREGYAALADRLEKLTAAADSRNATYRSEETP